MSLGDTGLHTGLPGTSGALTGHLTAIPNYDYILKSSKVEEGKRTR